MKASLTTLMLAAVMGLAWAQEMPNSLLTPGAVNPKLTKQVLCASSFRTGPYRHVTEATKRRVCAEYRIKGACPDGRYEIDHLISLELGGSNDIGNLWPQPYLPAPGARQKDVVETWLHRQVCAGKMTLEHAQNAISTDWYVLYQQRGKSRGR